jgi:hypothetical protein
MVRPKEVDMHRSVTWHHRGNGRRSVPFTLFALGIVLLVSAFALAQDERNLEFQTIIIGELRVEFHQRMIGEAIVEGDYIVRQYDLSSGALVKELRHWRSDLPDMLPEVLPREDAIAMVGGEVLFAQLYFISWESDIFPVRSGNPCWVIGRVVEREGDAVWLSMPVIDAVTGESLGNAVPPPYNGFSLTGPHCFQGAVDCAGKGVVSTACTGSWDGWYQNAATWFTAMGYYNTESVRYPTEAKVQSHVSSQTTAVFYELAHGGSTSFASGCVNGKTAESTTATEIHNWIAAYNQIPFTFIGSCGGMCSTGPGTFSYEFRKGANVGAATVGYCNMAGSYCVNHCWGYTIKWQDAFFKYCSQGKTVYQAYLLALADYPACATGTTTTIGAWTQNACIRFAGDQNLKLVPTVVRTHLYVPHLPDLRVLPRTIWEVNGLPFLELRLWIRIDGELPIAEAMMIDVLLDGELVQRQPAALPYPGEDGMIPFEIPVLEGPHEITVILDSTNVIEEIDEENNTFSFEFVKGGAGTGGECVDFEDPGYGTYPVFDALHDSGARIEVQPFQWSTGAWTYGGVLDIGAAGRAGGSGQEAGTNNVNLAVALPTGCEVMTLRFGEFGGNINVGINGDFRNVQNFADLHGAVIGGVPVTVVNGYGDDQGTVRLEGAVWPSTFWLDGTPVEASLIIGGQELWIDDICCE